jgi:hypothetical protein
MLNTPFLWLIAIPLLSSPLIYLAGRLAALSPGYNKMQDLTLVKNPAERLSQEQPL